MNYYINNDWYRNGMINNNQPNLLNPQEGYLKGNIFRNLYSPYKNYQPFTLKPSNEKEKMLYELSAYSFAAHDLNLYLDLHPENQSMFLLFQDYQKKTNRLIEEYERKFGPLNINSEEMKDSFTWESNDWPWEVKNV